MKCQLTIPEMENLVMPLIYRASNKALWPRATSLIRYCEDSDDELLVLTYFFASSLLASSTPPDRCANRKLS